MMFKSEEQQRIEQVAKQIQKKDKRLSWKTCLQKAKSKSRLFNQG